MDVELEHVVLLALEHQVRNFRAPVKVDLQRSVECFPGTIALIDTTETGPTRQRSAMTRGADDFRSLSLSLFQA